MPLENIKNYDLYYSDPRLSMTLPGRLFVRTFSYIGYIVFIAAAFTFILSDVLWLRLVGAFFALFFVDRLMHFGQADRPFSELPRGGRVNLASYISPAAFALLEKAFDRSIIAKHNFFLEATRELLNFSDICGGLKRMDVPFEEFKQKTEEFLTASHEENGLVSEDKNRPSSTQILVINAFAEAMNAGHKFIERSDLFSAMPKTQDETIGRLFNIFSIDAGDLGRALVFSSIGKSLGSLPNTLGGFVLNTPRLRHRVMNRAWTARPTPTLDKYSADFTDLARQNQAGFLVGHEEEFRRLIETLARPINPNALLVGETGIGKEALVAHLALLLTKDEVPPALFDKRLVALELGNVVAGATPEELNARLKKIVEEIIAASNIILYIPDIHNLVRTSGTAYLSAADELMPIITNNAFPVVGATYPKEFKQLIEPRSDFAGIFEIIRINEITEMEAEKILTYESLLLERQYHITISFGAIKKSVLLAKKYFRNKFLPSSAEELLKSSLVSASERGEKLLGPDRVISAVEEKVNVPIHEAGAAEAEKLLGLEDAIHERLIDQDEAVKAVADALREYRSGLSRQAGPIANFLFVGPTGVGKTELAKILSRIQFGSEKTMVRFDMTEYQDKQSFYRFIGSPDGQISGALTDAILQKPYSLILLDEFEKAFPDILNLFLQVFDDGRLTDNLGRLVDFTNTIIIATSNAHSDIINESLSKGESMSDIAEYLKKKLVDVFKPELLNRFSKIVVFKNLEPNDLEKIVVLNLKDVADALSPQGITMSFDKNVVGQIVKLGYDPAFGARPLRRVIDEKLRAPLAKQILEKKIVRGGVVKLILREGDFEFVPDTNT